MPQVQFNLEQMDDPVQADGVPDFTGGQFSNWRANLLKPDQSKELINADFDKLGKIRTRRGSVRIGSGTAGTGTLIQGLTSYQTPTFNYVVAANGAKIWAFDGVNWNQIATGGVADDDAIVIGRAGIVNNSAGYPVGATVLTVDGITGIVGIGESLYFLNNVKDQLWKYIINGHTETGGNTTQITIESPGLVFPVQDDWTFVVLRPAQINNPTGYPAGYSGVMAIDNYGVSGGVTTGGAVNTGEFFIIKSENLTRTISAHSETGGNTTAITGSTPLQASYVASSSTVPIVFAEGMDQLFFCDGVGAIYGWNGKTTLNLSNQSYLDILSGNASYFTQGRTTPPVGPTALIWFQNRLIAAGMASLPDTIYFSDILDPTSWDSDYQSLRVGGGESDPITGLIPWTDLNILVTKKNSIYLIDTDPTQNPDPTDPTLLVSSFAIKKIHGLIGCPAPGTAVQVGGGSSSPGSDIFFLDGDKRVRSIRRVLAAETQQQIGDAISLPIQDYLDRCNIQYIQTSVSEYHNDHYILAFPIDGATRPNTVVAYNLLTQTWCGEWNGWTPTCFSRRTDLGSYSKLIFGQSTETSGAGGITLVDNGGMVFQWLDDLSLQDETPATYQDNGVDMQTSILTRAITFGDPFAYKTGLSVEFEFDESVATVTIQVILDKVPQSQLIAVPFSTLSAPAIRLPVVIPFTLGSSPALLRVAFDLQRYGTWRELQFMLTTTQGKLAMRSIRVMGFLDTVQLQTLMAPPPPVGAPVLVTGDDGLNISGDDGITVTA